MLDLVLCDRQSIQTAMAFAGKPQLALHGVAVLDNASALPANGALLNTNWSFLFERIDAHRTLETILAQLERRH